MKIHIQINSFNKYSHHMLDTMLASGAADVNQTDHLLDSETVVVDEGRECNTK